MTNILYIHGFGGSSESQTGKNLRKYLGEDFNVFTHSFSNDLGKFETMKQNIKMARQLICSKKIKMVVGSSMGAFVAMNCGGSIKVLINPCMLPSEQIKLRVDTSITDDELEKYREFEDSMIIDIEEKLFTFGLFATNDELFSYRDHFNKIYYEKYARTMSEGHRISECNVKNKLIPLINFAVAESTEHCRLMKLQDKYSIIDQAFIDDYD